MPYPLDLDPLVPQAPVTPEPWSWVPPEWAQGGGVVPTLPPEAPAIPPDNTGASWFVPPEWSAPAQPAVPPEWLPPTGAPEVAPAPTAPPLQPGLPIPSQTLEAAAAAPPMAPHVPTVDEQAYAESADPLAAGFKTIDLEAARGEVKRTAQQRADDASRDAAVANMRILHEANERTRTDLAKIDADYKALVEQKIGWASKSAPQKIAGIVAAIVGGLVQSRTGAARNQGVDMVDHIIEGEIAEHHQKMAELAGRRKDVTAQFGQSLDTFRTEETLRQSMWELAARDVETKAAGFDPKGTTYAKKIALATEFRQRAAAAKAAAQERLFKDRLELSKHALETDKFRLEVQKQRAAEARAAAGAKVDALIQPDEARRVFGIDIPRPMKQSEINARLEGLGKSQDLAKNANTTGLSKEELERTVPGLEIEVQNPDGTVSTRPYLAVGAPEESKKLRNTVTSTKQLVRLLDEVRRIRTGWTSDTVKSPEWQKLQANWASAVGKAKGEGQLALGVLTGPDLDIVGRFLGAADPTRVIGIEAGVAKARENLINDTNDAAEGLAPPGAKVKRFDVPYIKPEPPKLDHDDEAYKAALSKHASDADADRILEAASEGGRSPSSDAIGMAASARLGLGTDPKTYIDGLLDAINRGDDKARAKAIERLTGLANGAAVPGVRDYAQARLTSIIGSGLTQAQTPEEVR